MCNVLQIPHPAHLPNAVARMQIAKTEVEAGYVLAAASAAIWANRLRLALVFGRPNFYWIIAPLVENERSRSNLADAKQLQHACVARNS